MRFNTNIDNPQLDTALIQDPDQANDIHGVPTKAIEFGRNQTIS
jgi:hypothetical protein